MASRQRLVLEVDGGSSDTDSSSSDSDEEVQETCPTNDAGEKLTRRLPSAAKANISAWGRKMLVNPPGCRKRRRGGDSTKLTRTSKHDRAKEFPGEHLIVENNVLFCNACRTEISMKKSIVKTHIRSKRHSDGKVRMEKEAGRQVSIQSAWQAYEKKVNR